MAEIKLTKNELRAQQKRLSQLEKYLPTLQLKKAMLQSEVNEARVEIVVCQDQFHDQEKEVEGYSSLLSENIAVDPQALTEITSVDKKYENIAGVDVPQLEGVQYADVEYSLFDTPPWLEAVTQGLRKLRTAKEKVNVAEEKKAALEKELREVSIRVNLFEKILIPRSLKNIKKIKVFLGDQELAAVSQAKVAKGKIEARKEAARAS